MKLIILFLAMLIANPAFAETCVNEYGGNNSCAEDAGHKTAGDCTTLGYSATRCASGQAFLRCPFDETKLRCIENEKPKIDFSTLEDWSTQKPDCNTNASDKLLTYTQDGKTYYRCVLSKELTCADFFGDFESEIDEFDEVWCYYDGIKNCENVCDKDGNNCRTVSGCSKLFIPRQIPNFSSFTLDFYNDTYYEPTTCGSFSDKYLEFKKWGYEKHLDFLKKTYKDIVGVDELKECWNVKKYGLKEKCDSKCSEDKTYCKVCEEIEKELNK